MACEVTCGNCEHIGNEVIPTILLRLCNNLYSGVTYTHPESTPVDALVANGRPNLARRLRERDCTPRCYKAKLDGGIDETKVVEPNGPSDKLSIKINKLTPQEAQAFSRS